MKTVVHLDHEDIESAVRQYLESQGKQVGSVNIIIKSEIPGDRPFDTTTPASVSVECEVTT